MLDMMEIPADKEVDMTELANFYATSIMHVLTQRIYLGDAHENNQCVFCIVQLLHNIFEHVYNPEN